MTCQNGLDTYPYTRLITAPKLIGAEAIPRKVAQYLMDLPLPGYEPRDDNGLARCRLMKYLYYDEENPLSYPMPTAQEKLSLLYLPERAANPPTEKGYRMFPQSYVAQSQMNAQTRIMVYMGRTIAADAQQVEMSVVFDILSNVTTEGNAIALSRTFAMEQCIIEALNGVNMGGVGTFYFNRRDHGDCGSMPIGDRGTNVGRGLTMGLTWVE